MPEAQAELPATVAAEQPRAASVRTPRLRLPVAVLVSRFPVVTETFILRELIELERQGQPVVLVPLLRQKVEVVHREAEPWVKRALYTPFFSARIAAANWRCLRARPRDYARLLWAVVKGNAGSPHMLVRALAFFPKTVHLAERLQAEGVGHVHAHFATHPGMSAWLIGALTGIPYSLTVHAHDIFVRRDMLEVKLAGARFVRCISEFNRRFLAERYPDAAHKLVVVHTGVDPDADLPERPMRVVPAGSAPRVLCVAAMKPYKGHLVLLEACRLLEKRGVDFVCELVGEGPLRGRIEREVKRAGLLERVRLLGARPQHDVAALISQARVVVLPSVVAADGQMEGLPVTLMEAMAAGCPVVAPALSGIPELVEDGINGLLVPTGDVEALAAALQRLLLEPKVARWMGEQGRRKVVREFALRDCVSQLLGWFDRERQPAPAV